MQPARVECPWCGMEMGVADVAKASVYGIHGEVEPDEFVEEAVNSGRLIGCENRSCWAPCEAIFCASAKAAEDVRRLLSRIVWSSPRRIPAKNEGGSAV